MRLVICCLLAACVATGAAPRAAAAPAEFSTPERIMQWTFTYRSHAEPNKVPAAVHAMRDLGLLRDEEKTGFFIGFIAGVLRDNPRRAEALIARMFPMPPKEQAVIVKAIAYSGLSEWPVLLTRFAKRMPERKPLIEAFLSGREPTLLEVPWDAGPTLIYTLWGYYAATGHYAPVRRIVAALEWSRDAAAEASAFSWSGILSSIGWSTDPVDIDRLTIGSTAKWTLVSYAEHHRDLLDLYRVELMVQSDEVKRPLEEVLTAAEAFDAERVRKQEMAAIEDARRRVAAQGSPMSRAAYAGSVGIATACVVAGATGHPEIAVPCVVTGALYSGAMKLLNAP